MRGMISRRCATESCFSSAMTDTRYPAPNLFLRRTDGPRALAVQVINCRSIHQTHDYLHYLAFEHDCHSIAKTFCFLHKMCGENDGAITLEFLNKCPYMTTIHRIHTGSWLVHNNQLRFTDCGDDH
jgi:hypothetical protein